MRRLVQWCVKVQATFPALRKIQDFYERYGSVHQPGYWLSHFIYGLHTSCLVAWVSAISLMVSRKNHVKYCLTTLYAWAKRKRREGFALPWDFLAFSKKLRRLANWKLPDALGACAPYFVDLHLTGCNERLRLQ